MLTWNVLRAAGIGAYLMLWASVAWGLFGTTGLGATKFARASSTTIHAFFSTAGLTLLCVHLIGVLLDEEVGFTPLDILVPQHSSWRPLAVTFGILAMYTTVVIVASSFARKRIGVAWWRRLHLLAVPAFIMALGHGVAAGTDTQRPWMFWTYAATSLILVGLLFMRGLTAKPKKRTKAAGRPAEQTSRGKVTEAA